MQDVTTLGYKIKLCDLRTGIRFFPPSTLETMAVLTTEKTGDGNLGGVAAVDSFSEAATFVDPKEERALVWRLDCIFLVVGFLGYTFKYLDQTNIVSMLPAPMHVR